MPNEFTVIGEHRDDGTMLLVIGTDGRYYGYLPAREHFATIAELDDRWLIQAPPDDTLASLPIEEDPR